MSLPTNISIMIASHKSYDFPYDIGYLPIHVGKELNPSNLGFKGDETGDNISRKNKSFCELTGLYWLWKNQSSDFVGLSHYRRYFKSIKDRSLLIRGSAIASSSDLLDLMTEYDVLVTKKRCYFIDTIRSHYKHSHNESDLLELRKIILELKPDYLNAFDYVLESRCISLYNMFIMNRTNFEAYSEWLFNILFELEKRIPYKEYGVYQGRIFGFLAERLLNVWLEHHKKELNVGYLPIVNIEGENLFKKAMGLLKRKFLGKKLD